jgi:hypothetical protein
VSHHHRRHHRRHRASRLPHASARRPHRRPRVIASDRRRRWWARRRGTSSAARSAATSRPSCSASYAAQPTTARRQTIARSLAEPCHGTHWWLLHITFINDHGGHSHQLRLVLCRMSAAAAAAAAAAACPDEPMRCPGLAMMCACASEFEPAGRHGRHGRYTAGRALRTGSLM